MYAHEKNYTELTPFFFKIILTLYNENCTVPPNIFTIQFFSANSSFTVTSSVIKIMCGSRKYRYSPHGRSFEISRGSRVLLKVKLSEKKYEA